MFGHISAVLNPAVCLAGLVLGKYSFAEFVALSASELLGAFLGALSTYAHYYPHFCLVPQAPASSEPGDSSKLASEIFVLREDTLGGASRSTTQTDASSAALLRPFRAPGQAPLGGFVEDCGVRRDSCATEEGKSFSLLPGGQAVPGPAPPSPLIPDGPPADLREQTRERQLTRHEQDLLADQHNKLSVFSTRPAVPAPLCNFLCEVLSTAVLVLGATLMGARGDQLFAPERRLFDAGFGVVVGLFVFLLVLVLGGPTGLAVNPARDLGPRLAHWLLPIPNKGSSELLSYGWIPVLAPFAGGALGGGLLRAIFLFTSDSNLPPNAQLHCQILQGV